MLKKFAVSNVIIAFWIFFFGVCVSVSAVFALSNVNLSTRLSVRQQINFASALEFSADGTNYTYFYDNTRTNEVTRTNFSVTPLLDNKLKFAIKYEDLNTTQTGDTVTKVYFRLTNYTSGSTLNLDIDEFLAYGKLSSVAGINAQSASYNETCTIEVNIPSSAESDDSLAFTLHIFV